MNRTLHRRRIRTASLVAAVALAGAAAGGCSLVPRAEPDPTRYFVLDAAARPGTDQPAATPRVAIAPVVLGPGYLAGTRSLVVRREGNEIRYDDVARWAEPLETGIARVLREAIPGAVAFAPGRRPREDAPGSLPVVRVEVQRCEGVLGEGGDGVAYFSAVYELSPGAPGGAVQRATFIDRERAWDGRDPARLAALLGEAVRALAADIAARLPGAAASH